MRLRILGCAGGIGGRERFTTSLLVDHDLLLDAGTGLTSLDVDQLILIDHVFITHCHLDHVAGLALLLDAVQGRRSGPITVHATEPVIGALKKHLFNWVLWPDFATIPDSAHPALCWEALPPDGAVQLNGRRLQAFPVNHTPGSSAYLVRSGAIDAPAGFLFTGDMGSTPALWKAMAAESGLKKIIVDCSFTNADVVLAEKSLHFCPSTLLAEVAGFPRTAEFLIYHLKPGYEDQIMQELCAGGDGHAFAALKCGDVFDF